MWLLGKLPKGSRQLRLQLRRQMLLQELETPKRESVCIYVISAPQAIGRQHTGNSQKGVGLRKWLWFGASGASPGNSQKGVETSIYLSVPQKPLRNWKLPKGSRNRHLGSATCFILHLISLLIFLHPETGTSALQPDLYMISCNGNSQKGVETCLSRCKYPS